MVVLGSNQLLHGKPVIIHGDDFACEVRPSAAILARRDRDESIREITNGLGVSVGTVHGVLTERKAAELVEAES